MSPRRLTAAALLLAAAVYVPACEYDHIRPKSGSNPEVAQETVPPASPNA